MALNADILAESIAARYGNPPTDFLKILCEEIIQHITLYAQVSTPLIVVGTAPPGGGPVVAQTVPSPPGVIK